MSYDVWLEVRTGPNRDATMTAGWWNYTSNGAPMWRAAGCDLAEFHGRPAFDLAPVAAAAAAEIAAHPSKYRDLEPDNGWGSMAGVIEYLGDIAEACALHQFAVVRVSR
jgi:hypothetical protein